MDKQGAWALMAGGPTARNQPRRALANATGTEAGKDSKPQKPPDLARRKAVGYNPLLGCNPRDGFRMRSMAISISAIRVQACAWAFSMGSGESVCEALY
jgi:hypothetical protein